MFHRIDRLSLLATLGLLAACAHPLSAAQEPVRAVSETETAALAMTTELAPVPAPAPLPPQNEILKDILPCDIARAQAEVKKFILPHWEIIAERSSFVRYRLEKALDEIDAPLFLEVVPVIESGYNPYALSPAGAMGLWQLMPRTAKGMGALNSKGQNARRDIESSTEAAAAYLFRLKERFGNWPLAFAAYNYGPTALTKRLKRSPWSPADGLDAMPVPGMTRAYVRHLIGFIALMQMHAVAFPEAIQTKEISLMPPVDLKQLADLSGLDRELIFKLNPGLDHSQYLNHEVAIHIPEEAWSSVEPQIEAIAPKYVDIPIRSGDSLWTLARRHHTTISHLKRINPDLGSVLNIGKTIKVPANQLARAMPTPNPLLSKGRGIRYKVKAGDNLWVIAKRFGTTPLAIARSNQITTRTLIRPGDTLWIYARIRPS